MHRRNCSTVNTTGSLGKQFYLLFYCHDEEGCFDLDISSPISKQFPPSPSRAGRCKVQWPQLTPEIRETFEQMQRHSGEGRETETSLSWPSSLSAEFTIIAVAGEGETSGMANPGAFPRPRVFSTCRNISREQSESEASLILFGRNAGRRPTDLVTNSRHTGSDFTMTSMTSVRGSFVYFRIITAREMVSLDERYPRMSSVTWEMSWTVPCLKGVL